MDERSLGATAQDHLPPPRTDEAGSGAPDTTLLQVLSTEHWSLLSARSLVYNEAFARAGMFLTFLSASLVAIGFLANAMTVGHDFLVIACILLALDLVIGLATVGRLLSATMDDLHAIRGMNRIRHGYAEIAPTALPYFVTSVHDDVVGVMTAYGGSSTATGWLASLLHGLTTTSGMIGLIDSFLAGAVAGLVAALLGLSSTVALVVGVVAFVVMFMAVMGSSVRRIRGFERAVEARFPTPR